jgi:ATP-dependent helicase/nuclease subunit A
METLIDLTKEFADRLKQKKQEKKILDFSDMEHFALNILIRKEGDMLLPSPVAKEYREHFEEILIDEYQDSNLVQEYLLLAVSGEWSGMYNRFMVGDVKQSIYKFRLANPQLFLDKYNTYEKTDGKLQRIDLSMNFRSRDTVIDTVNHVFERLMSEETGGIAYDENAALYAGLPYPENAESFSELLLLNKPDAEEETDAKEAEARLLAKKIKELKAGYMVTQKGGDILRPAQYKDMVILLRTTSGWDETFKKVLEAEGIPVYITSKTGYFAATEVQELLQFLRVLDNPRQDIPLFGTMKSIFGGFTEEEIAKLRSMDRKACLWDLLCGQVVVPQGDEAEEDNTGKSAEQSETEVFAKKAADSSRCSSISDTGSPVNLENSA